MLGEMEKTPRCMLQRKDEIPTLFHYYSHTMQMSIAGDGWTRLPCIGLLTVEHSVLGKVFLTMVQISMLETRMVGLHCIGVCAQPKNMLSLFKCYWNAGQ